MSAGCPACGEAGSRPGRRLCGVRVRACPACDLRWCDPLPQLASDSSGAHSVATDEAYTAELLRPSPRRDARAAALGAARHAAYSRRLGRSRFRLLEVGCATAALARSLVQAGVEYEGIDLDARTVEAARRGGLTGVRRGDYLELEAERPWDVIVLSQVLEHVTEPRGLVAKLARDLAPGGLVHIDVPNHNSLSGRLHRVAALSPSRHGALEPPFHAIAYTARALRSLLETRFEAEVFTANPDHHVWGQATTPTAAQRAFFLLGRPLGLGSLLVALGRPRASVPPALHGSAPGAEVRNHR